MTEQFTAWFSGRYLMSRNARLQIKGAYVPLKYWSEVYAKNRGEAGRSFGPGMGKRKMRAGGG
jgi:hypothetical protein